MAREACITAKFPLPPGLNKIINNNRTSKYAGAGMKKTWTNKCHDVCKKQIRQCPIVPVYMAVHYRISTRANDVDNIQSTKKFILDGMVKAGILKDDNFTHIQPMIFETFEFIGTKNKDYTVDVMLFVDKAGFNSYILDNQILSLYESRNQIS